MIRLGVTSLALALTYGGALAAGTPMVRVTVSGDRAALVGSQVEVRVQVLAPNYFMSSVEFPPLDVEDAIVTLPDQRAANSTETIDGQRYSAIAKTYLVTPLAAGKLSLPASSIEFSYAAVPGTASHGSVTFPATSIEARDPPGASSAGTVPVGRLHVAQTLDHDASALKKLKVGDVLTRTVTVTADRARAMLIPPPTFTVPEGIQSYGTAPVLKDEGGRGQRIDVATYLMQRAGEFTLPPVEIDWYDDASSRVMTARAAAIDIVVMSVGAPRTAIPPDPPPDPVMNDRNSVRRMLPWFALAFAVIGLGVLAGRFLMPRVKARLASRWEGRERSEAEAFRQVVSAVRRKERASTYRALSTWAFRLGHASLREWTRSTGSAPLQQAVAELERDLFSMPVALGEWEGGGAFLMAAAEWRKGFMKREPTMRSSDRALPPLNPTALDARQPRTGT